jgi:hypothetical protein
MSSKIGEAERSPGESVYLKIGIKANTQAVPGGAGVEGSSIFGA